MEERKAKIHAMMDKLGMQKGSKCSNKFMRDLNEYGMKQIRERNDVLT